MTTKNSAPQPNDAPRKLMGHRRCETRVAHVDSAAETTNASLEEAFRISTARSKR